jgi:hypothetical protein
MLFWAEGSRERNAVIFTNSDPALVSYFARFLRRLRPAGVARLVG